MTANRRPHEGAFYVLDEETQEPVAMRAPEHRESVQYSV